MFSISVPLHALDALGRFLRSTSNISSASDNTPLLFAFSNSFKAFFPFTSEL